MIDQTTLKKPNKALIYCRVSSIRQVNEGHGLDSQEKRCRDYANNKGYQIIKVFPDEGISGGLFERPAMHNIIEYIDDHPTERFVIIFDDLARFSRDVKVHLQLKSELEGRGALLECLNFNFEDSPESEFAETVMVAGNQYHRKQNRRQVIQKQKARLEDGFWAFGTPPALENIPHPVYKRILNGLVQPYANIYKSAFEKYSYDELNTLEEVRNFINKQYTLYGLNKKISISGVTRTLTKVLYAGWLEYPKWNVSLRKAKHDGFVTKEIFDIVQAKLMGKAKPRLRKDYTLDFPLRPWVLCDTCGKPMTASWPRGKRSRHPYYFCKNKSCSIVWKSIIRKTIHDDFESLLLTKKPPQDRFDLAKAIFMDVWESKKANSDILEKVNEEEANKLAVKIKNLARLISKTANDKLIEVYEKELEVLVNEQESLQGLAKTDKYTNGKLGTMFQKVINVLEQPIAMWKSDNIEERRTILFMYFEERLRYNRLTGFGTPKLASAIKLIHSLDAPKNDRVEVARVELASGETRKYKSLVRDRLSLIGLKLENNRVRL